MDGGVCKGTDILKALALGAKAVFVGCPVLEAGLPGIMLTKPKQYMILKLKNMTIYCI